MAASLRFYTSEYNATQPRPRPGGLMLHLGFVSYHPLPSLVFSTEWPSSFVQFEVYPSAHFDISGVQGAAFPAGLDSSIAISFDYLRVTTSDFAFEYPEFRGGAPTRLPQVRLPRGTISCCWAQALVDSFCTISQVPYQSISYEIAVDARPSQTIAEESKRGREVNPMFFPIRLVSGAMYVCSARADKLETKILNNKNLCAVT